MGRPPPFDGLDEWPATHKAIAPGGRAIGASGDTVLAGGLETAPPHLCGDRHNARLWR